MDEDSKKNLFKPCLLTLVDSGLVISLSSVILSGVLVEKNNIFVFTAILFTIITILLWKFRREIKKRYG